MMNCSPSAVRIASERADDGEDERLAAVNEMAAVELGGDPDGQGELAHRRIGPVGVGDGTDEIAAKTDEDLGGTAPIAATLSTVWWPWARGGSNPKTSRTRSR